VGGYQGGACDRWFVVLHTDIDSLQSCLRSRQATDKLTDFLNDGMNRKRKRILSHGEYVAVYT
jgi:hypothetical protein